MFKKYEPKMFQNYSSTKSIVIIFINRSTMYPTNNPLTSFQQISCLILTNTKFLPCHLKQELGLHSILIPSLYEFFFKCLVPRPYQDGYLFKITNIGIRLVCSKVDTSPTLVSMTQSELYCHSTIHRYDVQMYKLIQITCVN